MSTYLNIKPYSVPNDFGYTFANAIYWTVPYLGRGDTSSTIVCDLVNISSGQTTDEFGNIISGPIISPSLEHFEMIADEDLLNSWGPDSVIDDFVLTYDPNFERE
jgi:hypothetical protein